VLRSGQGKNQFGAVLITESLSAPDPRASGSSERNFVSPSALAAIAAGTPVPSVKVMPSPQVLVIEPGPPCVGLIGPSAPPRQSSTMPP
jgi:hypothetical protein